MTTLTIKSKILTKADGTTYTVFKYVAANGKMVDLHFKRDVQISLFDGMTKFTASFEEFNDCGERYEYPRAYASKLIANSIVKIF